MILRNYIKDLAGNENPVATSIVVTVHTETAF